ncbi:U5 snRNP complex subunit AAR2 Ecym_4679 [Eremothecium cymbalariae DBVPG|uniref:A1 cistron-splicing factor AAR2 n=1 Tax=Eremothecium cymbalariae (strain CBS 270.75 / DBVPG 7215 / KCTC 17166 / NRRL Y-17582) TaxID=931890 RepID=G8JSH8_ERECY|nr:hypothetical protein Ecym_4679 [Eremothecium cymbalariae DBVPG\
MNIFLDSIAGKDLILGIDHHSFQLKPGHPFYGIKGISTQYKFHVVHFQHGDNGLRYGYWFESNDTACIVFAYDITKELYVPQLTSYGNDDAACRIADRLRQSLPFMFQYPKIDDEDTWHTLTQHMKWTDIRYWTETTSPHHCLAYVDSSMTTAQENRLLKNTLLANRIPNQQREITVPETEPILNYTPIVFKSSAALRPEHKTNDYLDKSWYLNHVILPQYHCGSLLSLLGELQFAFLNTLIFSNYGSSIQWHSITELLCRSSQIPPRHLQQLDSILAAQLAILPKEHADAFLNEKLWLTCLAGRGAADPGDISHRTHLPLTIQQLRNLLPPSPVAANGDDEDDWDAGWDAGRGAGAGTASASDSDEYAPTVVTRTFHQLRPA